MGLVWLKFMLYQKRLEMLLYCLLTMKADYLKWYWFHVHEEFCCFQIQALKLFPFLDKLIKLHRAPCLHGQSCVPM